MDTSGVPSSPDRIRNGLTRQCASVLVVSVRCGEPRTMATCAISFPVTMSAKPPAAYNSLTWGMRHPTSANLIWYTYSHHTPD